MSAPKHTPGPWRVWDEVAAEVFPDLSGSRVAYCGSAADATHMANARLIAAAPELLAVLKDLTALEGPLPGNVEWFRKARAAIDRAEGRA